MNASAPSANMPALFAANLVLLARRLLAVALLSSGLIAQTRPTDPGGGGGTVTPPIGTLPGGGGNTGGGGGGIGGGGIIGTLPIIPGGGGGTTVTQPTIIAPAGALVGVSVSASVALGQAGTSETSSSGVTYQWSISGGRITTDSRGATIQFVAESAGTVNLGVNISAAGTSFSPTATVAIVSAETAGTVTAPASVAANATSVAASVPAAQNNDRSFRWVINGGANIVNGQGTNSITFRPTSAGLKEVICNVNLRNVVTVPVRSYVVVLGVGAPVAVTVNGGSGGGTYPAGSRVDLIANPPASGQVFDRWIGTTEVLGTGALAAAISRATITVPATAVTLTATYKDAPIWTPTVISNFNPQSQTAANNTTTIVATTLSYHVPAGASGLVFLLHATGSSTSEWFERPQQLLLARELVAAGFGIAALNSVNRTAGTWAAPDVLANNPDALNHAAALDRLTALGALEAGKPIFLLGNTAGANAAVRYADLLATASPARNVRGAVLFLSAGIDTLAITSRVPQFFALAANDSLLGITGLQDARSASQILQGRGVATAVVTNALAPVYASRFRSLGLTSTSFTADDAQAVWTAIKSAGFIDANSYPKSVPSVAALTAALPAAYRDRAADIVAEIAVAAAEHEMFSDANARVISFLQSRAAGIPAPAPGRLINLSTRGNVAYLGDSLSVGFTLVGTQRATLLIRGVGPTLSRFRVGDPLAAARLEVYRGTTAIATNEGWDNPGGTATRAQFNAAAASVGAFNLINNSLDSAVLLQLDAGSYTATIKGIGGATGDVLTEIYDVSRNGTRLTNLSTLSRINAEGDLLIPGIVIAGDTPRTLVVRAVSQGLTRFGLTSDLVIGDARITILSGQQIVANNNNWAQAGAATLTAAFPAVGAFPLSNASDAALLEALAPGSYTLQAGAAPAGGASANQTGSVLVELYELP